MNCPRCPSTLQAFDTAEGETVDYCSACGGTWYDDGELEAVLGLSRMIRIRRAATDPKPGPTCPRCAIAMNEVSYPKTDPVRIDICPECQGIWLDKSELNQLRAAQARPPRGAPAPDAHNFVVPIKASHRRFDFWSFVGSLFVLVFCGGAALGLLSIFGALEHLKDDGLVHIDEVVVVGAALLGLPLGGIVMGRISPGFTVWEPPAAAVPILVAFSWFFASALTPMGIGVIVASGVTLTVLGTALGEKLQLS